MSEQGRKRTAMSAVGALVVASLAGFLWVRHADTAKSSGPPKIVATGAIEATEVDVSAEIGGTVTSLMVDEGDRVDSGELIAQLDQSQLEAEVLRAEGALASAKSNVRDLEAGARPQELQQARARVELAKAKLALDEAEWKRSKNLFEQGIVSEHVRDTALASRDVSRGQYEVAVQELQLLEAGARPDRIQAARSEVEQARAALALAKVRLEKSKISSPLSGTVLVKDVEAGEVVSPGVPIVTIADLDDMWVKIYISESDVGKIKLGQKAAVRVDAFSSQEFSGHVTYISDTAEFTPKNIQTREDRVKLVFAVKIGVDNAGGILKPGMYADVELDALSPRVPAHPAPAEE